MNANPKIYVAGHKGLVGSAIVRMLEGRGLTNIVTRSHKDLDLIDQGAVADFFATEKPEYVFLAAAKVGGIMANVTYGAEFIYENLMIQTNTMHQSMLHDVKRLVFLGSSCIYPKMATQPIKEESLLTGPLEPTNSPYAVAKIAGIEMCWAYNAQYGTSFAPVMPTNLYGPRDNFDLQTSHVLPAMIRKFHLGKLAMAGDWDKIEADEERMGKIPNSIKDEIGYTKRDHSSCRVTLWGTGSPSREFLHVDDMARATGFVMFDTDTTELVNIGTGEEMTILDTATLIANIVGYSGDIIWDRDKPDGTARKVLDVRKINKMGWKHQIYLRQGLEKTYRSYLEAGRKEPL
ncbi:GDP-L-fucose synthase family protein [Pseudodesulfovibrio portus]|uniref:GDP-L-fucose synthase n=1 Tax=Pseudodesulfovibrio portus TaxID=231439 RepID=A0ABM8AVE5_9BACT|nr:GDP-L-fucose synthase [Pseudodesulfovibrio portus]BDQ35466.1 GDP-L-fucose synthase [Pseudodesulfovibrio portus]